MKILFTLLFLFTSVVFAKENTDHKKELVKMLESSTPVEDVADYIHESKTQDIFEEKLTAFLDIAAEWDEESRSEYTNSLQINFDQRNTTKFSNKLIAPVAIAGLAGFGLAQYLSENFFGASTQDLAVMLIAAPVWITTIAAAVKKISVKKVKFQDQVHNIIRLHEGKYVSGARDENMKKSLNSCVGALSPHKEMTYQIKL